MFQRIHILFVCTANISRSPVAAGLFANSAYYEAKSAGTSPAKNPAIKTVPVTQELIDWADQIFVMEEIHLKFLRDNFKVDGKHVQVMNVPDKFNAALAKDFEELNLIFKDKLREYLINR